MFLNSPFAPAVLPFLANFRLKTTQIWYYQASFWVLKMIIGERIKILRKAKGWSQGQLAEKVGADARQISRYENGHIAPSAEALVKLAVTLESSVDYILFEDAPRRPLRADDRDLVKYLQDMQEFSEEDKASLLNVLDAFVARNKIRSFARELG